MTMIKNICAQPNMCADIPEVYTITKNSPEHGTVELSKTSAMAGETVTITATPESVWYELDTIEVNNGSINGTSFIMPAGDVTVTVAFKEKVFASNTVVALHKNDENGTVLNIVDPASNGVLETPLKLSDIFGNDEITKTYLNNATISIYDTDCDAYYVNYGTDYNILVERTTYITNTLNIYLDM